MEMINSDGGHYKQLNNSITPNYDNESSSNTEDYIESQELISEDDNLKEDLQKTIPECYRSESSLKTQILSDNRNDEQFQTAALGQFMDILNDLDEVLDKSLLSCLDDGTQISDNDDDEDVICKVQEYMNQNVNRMHNLDGICVDNSTQLMAPNNLPSAPTLEEIISCESLSDRSHLPNLRRSLSLSDLSASHRQSTSTTIETIGNDNIRDSMRRLNPVALPELTDQDVFEPLTLPVILFLEHHVNMRPTSAPIQLQVTTTNLNPDGGSAPLIVGRHALLMNRAFSLPSPGGDSDVTGSHRVGHTTSHSVGSTHSSSSSNVSLNGAMALSSEIMDERIEESESPSLSAWPHDKSAILAVLSCTIGIFNISRFATFSIHFGASFIVQFLILSLLFGIPLFTLHLCLGRVLESGPMDMWRISPFFQGVGISLLITQALTGIYSIIGLSWILVYFRDSFISSNDSYKWAIPNELYSEDPQVMNGTSEIHVTLPQYFRGEVLQRSLKSNDSDLGTIKFQVVFNLAVVWMVVFVALSRGVRSYGKVIYALIFLAVTGTVVLSVKLLMIIPYESITNIFSDTEWSEFFINSNSWTAATQETFLTWGLLGACIMQLTSHKSPTVRTNGTLLRESTCVVMLTIAILLLGSFLANTCVLILKNCGYAFIPGSFETLRSSRFLWSASDPKPSPTLTTPVRFMGHYGSLVGITVFKSDISVSKDLSGWQPLQLATQIVPATLAVLPTDMLSPVWAVLFYFILIMFGIAQQLAIWHCVITGVLAINEKSLRVWETTITFLSCVFGLLAGLCLTTDAGIRIVHFVDYVWVGAWWQCALQVALIFGACLVRGRPYSPDVVVEPLFKGKSWPSAVSAGLLSFTWTLVLPVVLCAVAVLDYKTGQQWQLYNMKKNFVSYWPLWCRHLGVVMQQFTLLTVPAVAFIQTWRYISQGPPDIFECMQSLFRPRLGTTSLSTLEIRPPPNATTVLTSVTMPSGNEPPPKYTPPPSYSTATGARLLNTLRRSFRTLRRITTSSRNVDYQESSHIPITLSESVDLEGNGQYELSVPVSGSSSGPVIANTDETDSHINGPGSSSSGNSLNFTRDYIRKSFVRKSNSVKNIRSSLRRSFRYGGGLTTSNENLVRDAEPISNTVAMSAILDVESAAHARSIASVI